MSIIPLSAIELYAMRAALAGDHSKWHDLSFNGMIRYQCENLERAGASGLQAAQRAISYLFDSETVIALNQIDLDAPPPAAPTKQIGAVAQEITVPELPSSASLTPERERLASEAGAWERRYTEWAGRQANQTPMLFHQISGLVLGATAIGRRLYITVWGQDVHPNLYAMIVAVSTYYHKTTSLRLASSMLQRTMPHMMLPDPGSPENFMRQLSGDTALLENLRPSDRAKYMRGIPFAGQRAIFRDELSGLFRSMSKDYMAGMKERIMDMYDGYEEIPLSSNTRGTVIVHDVALTMFGTTTPAGLGCAITVNDWRDGNLARFVLISPETDYQDRPLSTDCEPPNDLDKTIRILHERLPHPPNVDAMGENVHMERWPVIIRPYSQFIAYGDALREMTSPGTTLDDRLRPLYGRHSVKALKVAIILAALDWVEDGCKERPIVQESHWWRAQQIAEEWRTSAHRVLNDLSFSEYSESEAKVRLALARNDSGGLTKTALLNITKLRVTAIDEVLQTLIEGGEVEAIVQKSTGGRCATIFRWVLDTPPLEKK